MKKKKRLDKMELFASRLKCLRIKKGWTQQELADRLGCSKGLVSFYENAKREAGFTVIGELADIFDVNPGYLTGEESAPILKKTGS